MSRSDLCNAFSQAAIAMTVMVAGGALGAISGAFSRMVRGGSILLGAGEGAVAGSAAALSSYGIAYNTKNYLDKKNINGVLATSVSTSLGVGVGAAIFGTAAAILVLPFLPPDRSNILMVVNWAGASAAVSGSIFGVLRPR